VRPAGFYAAKEELMSSGAARWALAHLDGWTWLVAEYRIWLITLATVTGLAVPLLVAARKHLPRPARCLRRLKQHPGGQSRPRALLVSVVSAVVWAGQAGGCRWQPPQSLSVIGAADSPGS
jgi:hypothetical protein